MGNLKQKIRQQKEREAEVKRRKEEVDHKRKMEE